MSNAVAVKVARVADFFDGIVEGSDWPLVPDGEYLASYAGHDCLVMRQFKDQPKVFVRFRLFDAGEHSGCVLFRAYRARRILDGKRFVVGPRSDLRRMVLHVLHQRARPDRISLRALKGLLLRVRTRTVTRDARQRNLPVPLAYSVIDEILGREAG